MPDDYFKPLANKLAQIPAKAESTAPIPPAIDNIAAKHGFVSREADEDLLPQRPPIGPTVMLTARAPVKVARRFKRFCAAHRYAYWEGIEVLMNRGGVE